MSNLTIACALVLAAQLAVVLVWRTWWTQSLRALQRSTELISARLDRSSQAQLRVEVDALAASVAKLSKSNRAEFGRLWGKVSTFEELHPFVDRDDVAAALVANGGELERAAGEGLKRVGVTRAANTGVVCACGWCASCLERAGAH